MKIEVMGPGCARCQSLAANAQAAVDELGLACEVTKLTDVNEIARRGILMTPALVIDGKLKTVGKVTSIKEIRDLLSATPQVQPQR
jgi:small redox-active disulfide protein 2